MSECKEFKERRLYEKECKYQDGIVRYFKNAIDDYIEGIEVKIGDDKEIAIIEDYRECADFSQISSVTTKLLTNGIVLCDDGLSIFITRDIERYGSASQIINEVMNYIREKLFSSSSSQS